jgi:hypothetical protein
MSRYQYTYLCNKNNYYFGLIDTLKSTIRGVYSDSKEYLDEYSIYIYTNYKGNYDKLPDKFPQDYNRLGQLSLEF